MRTDLSRRTAQFLAISEEWSSEKDDISPLTAISDRIRLEHADIPISIRHRLSPTIDGYGTVTSGGQRRNAVEFEVKLSRSAVRSYLNMVYIRQSQEGIKSADMAKKDKGNSVKSVVFNGEFFRDFQRRVSVILIANHIANPGAFTCQRLSSRGLRGELITEKFYLGIFNRRKIYEDLGLKNLNNEIVFDFIWNNGAEIHSKTKTQFMRGLSLLSQVFRSENEPLASFVWSISAIEAMMFQKGENGNARMIEERLRALYDGPNPDEVIGRFRKIYRYRNDVMHGLISVPFSFDSQWMGCMATRNGETPLHMMEQHSCMCLR